MKLVDVTLEDFMFPCFAYSMKRTGLNYSFNDFRKLKEQPVPKNTADIPIGAILRWDINNGEDNWVDNILTIKGQRVISTWNNINVHYGVYEGDGIVSDIVWDEKEIRIRLRELDKVYQQPRGMITDESLVASAKAKGKSTLSDDDYKILEEAQSRIESVKINAYTETEWDKISDMPHRL